MFRLVFQNTCKYWYIVHVKAFDLIDLLGDYEVSLNKITLIIVMKLGIYTTASDLKLITAVVIILKIFSKTCFFSLVNCNLLSNKKEVFFDHRSNVITYFYFHSK